MPFCTAKKVAQIFLRVCYQYEVPKKKGHPAPFSALRLTSLQAEESTKGVSVCDLGRAKISDGKGSDKSSSEKEISFHYNNVRVEVE